MVRFRETPSTLVGHLYRMQLCSGMKKIHENLLTQGFKMKANMMWFSRG